MNTEIGNTRIRWQEAVLELINIEMGFCSIQFLSWKKAVVKEAGKELRNLQNKNPYNQNDNI
jgi:hypothetical protein